jgi:capsular polysaccharide transport system permease protein
MWKQRLAIMNLYKKIFTPEMSLRRKFLLFVLLPTLLVAGYYAFFATDMYVSEAKFSIRGAEGGGGTDILSIFGQGSGSVTVDAYVVKDYVHSMGLLKILEERLRLRQHYQTDVADFFSRLSSDASAEEFLDYYRKVVRVVFDPVTSIVELRVRAYTPEMAQELGQNIIEQSELLVNHLKARALHDTLELARVELASAEQRISESRKSLVRFRQENDVLNPEAAVGSLVAMIAELESEAVKARTEMAEARSYMRDNSTQVVAYKARISALEEQIKEEKGRLIGTDQRVLNEVIADYESLMVDAEFAKQRYVSALTSLEAARIRAESKSRYLVAFSPPTLPDESIWPRRLPFTAMTFFGLTLLVGIFSLIIAAVREHAGF